MGKVSYIKYLALDHMIDSYFNVPSFKIAERKKGNKLSLRRMDLFIWDIGTKIYK